MSEAHWICPSSWRHVLSRSTLLRLQLTLQGSCPKAGPGLHAFPRPNHQVPFLGYSTEALLGWACFLCPCQLRAARVARCLRSALSQVCGASYRLPGPSPSVSWVRHESAVSGVPVCLLWGADLRLQPPWQMSTVQDPRKTWLAQSWSLLTVGGGCRLWGQGCPLPSGSGYRPPASLPPAGDGLVHTWLALLWYSLNPLFCEPAWQCQSFSRESSLSFFSLSGCPTVWVVISG